MFDSHVNFGFGVILDPPDPAISGTSLTLGAGEGGFFSDPPFNAVASPAGVLPLLSNAEIVRVTEIQGDTLTFLRAQENTNAQTIDAGWQFYESPTAKVFQDIESAIAALQADVPSFQTFTFATPSGEWVCAHDLGRSPRTIVVYDSAGNVRPFVPIANPDLNTTVLTPNPPLAGKVILS